MLLSQLIKPENVKPFPNQDSCLAPISAVAGEEEEGMKL